MIRIKKGLDLPISGAPEMKIDAGQDVSHVALLGRDYQDMKPTLLVAEGDHVVTGQPLFSDKKNPSVFYTSPGTGEVIAINRGERRVFLSLVIRLSGAEEEKTFPVTEEDQLDHLDQDDIEKRLVSSGLWPSFRTRPYSKSPVPGTRPAALFITAIDTNPLAADPQVVINERTKEFAAGLKIIRHLSAGNVYQCQAPNAKIPEVEGVAVKEFSGCHPAGLVGTHVHYLEHVNQRRTAWSIGYQDVIAIGYLFLNGRLLTERIVALGGPAVKSPRLIRTRLGACLSELVNDELLADQPRIISGSVLSGQTAADTVDFLGRYHNQVSVLEEGDQREFMGWCLPGFDKFSVKRLFASTFKPRHELAMTTSTHGSLRAMVPTGAFEKVMPLNVKATWLLRSLLTLDTDMAQSLGCLELDEEDLALCSFVCSGKMNYGYHLRQALQKIEKEG